MFSWFSRFTSKDSSSEQSSSSSRKDKEEYLDVEEDVDMFNEFGTFEQNILVVAGKKENDTVTRMIRTFSALYGVGHHFYPGNMELRKEAECKNDGIETLDYSRDVMEGILLSRKASLESYDIPPSILIYDKCVSQDDPVYKSIIANNKENRFTTMTIVSEMTDIDVNIMKKIDVFIICKERDRSKLSKRCKVMWEKNFSKLVTFGNFERSVMSAVGSMRVCVVSVNGIQMIKFGKNESKITNVCVFTGV